MFLNLFLVLKLQSGKLWIEIAGHLEFNRTYFSIVFAVDFKGSLEMIKYVTTGNVNTKLKEDLLRFQEFGDIEIDFPHVLNFDSEVFLHVK